MFVDTPMVDLIVNGVPEGPMAERLNQINFDPGLLRPWSDGDGQKYCDVKTGRTIENKEGERVEEVEAVPLQRLISNGTVPHTYNTTSLPKDVWERIDRQDTPLRNAIDRSQQFRRTDRRRRGRLWAQ